MLVLQRHDGERVFLINHATGERIVLKVWRHGRRATKLGIEAPDEWEIVREEIADDYQKAPVAREG